MSRLRAKTPDIKKKRLKLFLYGDAGSGKTTCCINFPNAYFIDTEKGAEQPQYVHILNKNNSVIFQTRSYEELYNEVKALATEKHPYTTLVIDSITPIFNNLVYENSMKFGVGHGTQYFHTYRQFEVLFNLLFEIDMNVLITAHEKDQKTKDGEIIGKTFDCYSKTKFLFDLTLNLQVVNNKNMAVVVKKRSKYFNIGELFEFNYQNIMDRYNREHEEFGNKEFGEAVPLNLITDEKLTELEELIGNTPNLSEWVNKCLASANVLALSSLSQEQGDKMITFLKSKQSSQLQLVK